MFLPFGSVLYYFFNLYISFDYCVLYLTNTDVRLTNDITAITPTLTLTCVKLPFGGRVCKLILGFIKDV